MSQWVVILAGGVGSRFWPLSTPTRPKQLLPLIDSHPLLRNTVERLLPLADPSRILILTNASLVEPIHALVPEIPRANLIAEPRPAASHRVSLYFSPPGSSGTAPRALSRVPRCPSAA